MRRALTITSLLLAAAALMACGGGKSDEGKPILDAAEARDLNESVEALQRQAQGLAMVASELQTLTVRITTLSEQVQDIQAGLEHHRALIVHAHEEPGEASGPRWLRDILIFILGIAGALILIFALQLLRGYDESDLPAEAYTPGMTASVPPESDEIDEDEGERT